MCKKKYALTVGKWLCYKTRAKALNILRGTMDDHYEKLPSYRAKLENVDKDGRFELVTKAIGPNRSPFLK